MQFYGRVYITTIWIAGQITKIYADLRLCQVKMYWKQGHFNSLFSSRYLSQGGLNHFKEDSSWNTEKYGWPTRKNFEF